MIDGEEVKDLKTLSKIKSVEEMLPELAENQIAKGNAAKIGEEQYRIIEETLKMDGTIEEACMLAGISVPSYYHHRKTNPEFERRMEVARQFPKLVARAAVQRRIRQGDAKTALRFLELRDKRYKADPVLEEGEEISAPVVQFISVPSDEGANNTTNQDSQTSTKQNSVFEGSASSGEKMTPRENEKEALRRLDSLSSSNE